jgi:hypothetical protein
MSPGLRKLALTAHLACTLGWLGALLGFLALAIAGLAGVEGRTMQACYVAMGLIAWFVIVPLAHGALLSGLVQALGTPWGLFRHYWVVAKLALTVLALAILVLKMGPISHLAAAADRGFEPADLFGLRVSVMAHAAGGVAVLLVIAGLAVYKPPGLLESRMPRWAKSFSVLLVGLVLMLAIMMIIGGHGPRAHAAASEGDKAVSIPLGDQSKWEVLQYSRIPPHKVRFTKAGLEMHVERSAMPLVHALAKPFATRRVRVKGRVEGTLNIPPGRQGEEGYDDYVFRIGLVEPGKRTLGSIQRRFVADWVKKLYELAPTGSGISGIRFFNVAVEKSHIGKKRQHPLSDLIREEVVALPRADGRFDFEHVLAQPLQTIAVWLSSDGDDTKSTFTVRVEAIELLAQ